MSVSPSREVQAALAPWKRPDTVMITCAALGKEVRSIIRTHDWHVDLRVINAKLHIRPELIGPAVDEKLTETSGTYRRQVVIFGHCGAADLDEVISRHDAIRTVGPHCYEMFGGEIFAQSIAEQPGTFFLTDFLVRAWEPLVVKGLKLDSHPRLVDLMFANYTRIKYFIQRRDEALIVKAKRIADSLSLPLETCETGYGDLEARLVAIMNDQPQPTSSLTSDIFDTAL